MENKYEELVATRENALAELDKYMTTNGVETANGLIQLSSDMYKEAQRLYNVYSDARRKVMIYERFNKQ